jgi:hypothetical protein
LLYCLRSLTDHRFFLVIQHVYIDIFRRISEATEVNLNAVFGTNRLVK